MFQDVKGGTARTINFFAKKARGMMVRWAVKHRATTPDALRGFDGGGYALDSSASTDTRWVFRRPQPPPVGR